MPLVSCFLVLIISVLATAGGTQKAADTKTTVSVTFNRTEYIHRWSQNDQHEFTPSGQEDLSKWVDMLTINFYPNVSDGEALARVANQVLENYKSQKAIVLKTDSVPRTNERPAEHLIAVVFGRPTFLEAVQTRLKMVNGKGVSIVYSHRMYGKAIGPQMSNWLKENGPSIEQALMSWEFPASLNAMQKVPAAKAPPRK